MKMKFAIRNISYVQNIIVQSAVFSTTLSFSILFNQHLTSLKNLLEFVVVRRGD